MLKEILYVNIGYKNGLYTFSNHGVCSEIPESIQVNTPFFNQENSLEELVEVIAEEPEENVVFSYNANNQNLVRRISEILAEEYERNIFLIGSGMKENRFFYNAKTRTYLLKDYESLEKVDEIECQQEQMVPRLQKEESKYDEGYFLAMKNGYDAFVTGIYPEDMTNTLAKHIQIESGERIEDLSRYLDVNGALLIKEKEGVLKTEEDVNHVHRVGKNQVDFDCSKYSFQNSVCSYRQFMDWKKAGKLKREFVYYLKIKTEEDLKVWEEELERFKVEQTIDNMEKRLVDECRWSNQCSLKRMARYSISNHEVKPCLTSENVLSGEKADSFEQIIEANKICDKTMIKRKCSSCTMSNYCSKCACLPEPISEERFCTFMHQYPFINEYLLKSRVVGFLGKYSKVFQQEEKIEVSSNVHGFEYPGRKEEGPTSKFVYLFRKNGAYFYFNVKTGTLIRMERKYVFLLEAWALEEEMEEIIRNMAETYDMSLQQAERVVAEGYQQLKRGGMIE